MTNISALLGLAVQRKENNNNREDTVCDLEAKNAANEGLVQARTSGLSPAPRKTVFLPALGKVSIFWAESSVYQSERVLCCATPFVAQICQRICANKRSLSWALSSPRPWTCSQLSIFIALDSLSCSSDAYYSDRFTDFIICIYSMLTIFYYIAIVIIVIFNDFIIISYEHFKPCQSKNLEIS